MNICIECGTETSNPKFCSLSCSGKYQKGRRSNLVDREKTCAQCGSIFQYMGTPKQRFCSQSCSVTYSNTRAPRRKGKPRETEKCLQCSFPLKLSSKKYCSVVCQTTYRRDKVLEKWKSSPEEITGLLPFSVREYLLSSANYCCSQCGWGEVHSVTGKVPIEIDHINGDACDNRPENLRVLCPNCHSLTSTYRALNKTSSRLYR